MRNLTIKIKSNFFNYDNLVNISFEIDAYSPKVSYFVNVLGPSGTYDQIFFKSKEEYEYAKEKLEEGLINGYVFIDLNKKEE